MLRTSLHLTGYSQPLQLVHREVGTPLEIHDLRDLAPDDQERALQQWARDLVQGPSDWSHPSLLRVHVHWRSEDSFQLSLCFHHAILDGWSLAVGLTELWRTYMHPRAERASASGCANALREFVAAEQRSLADERSRVFWRERLRDVQQCRLPRRESPVQPGTVGIFPAFELSGDQLDALRKLAAEIGVPLRSVLLAAHVRVLAALAQERDVVTGFVTSARPEAIGAEQAMGLFLNTLPLRVEVDRGDWRGLIARSFAAELDAMPHRAFPLAEIQRLCGGEPLFEVAFNYVHFHAHQGLEQVEGIERIDSISHAATNFALLAHFELTPGRASSLRLVFDYDPSILDAELLERIAGYYQTVLAAMVETPDGWIDAPLASTKERERVLVEWNETQREFPRTLCMHEMVAAQCVRTPDARAVSQGGQTLTYAGLARRVNQLARHLQNLGVGPEVRVGVMHDRSVDLIVAMLAILAAGGLYVPLDPNYPEGRVRFMLEDSGASLVLTRSTLADRLPQLDVTTLAIDTLDLESYSSNPLPSTSTADNLAYVIYTSGSTGRPKGVAIQHRSAVAMLAWAAEQFDASELRGVLAGTSICFDLSVYEIFLPLSVGGEVLLARDVLELNENPPERERVTLVNTVPSAMAELMRVGSLPAACKTVNLAGEPLMAELVATLEAAGVERVYDLYGPSEDTTYSTFARRRGDGPVTIGRPISNTRAYILDRNLHPVVRGAVGQLYLSGDGLARGYLGRPGQTAASFMPDPYSPHAGARMYGTGDVARFRADGSLEFLGRADNQVKIRGFRIELGEIEVALAKHPKVDACVVAARRLAGNKDQRLVAYVVAQGELSTSELREHASAELPHYMIPHEVVRLTELPQLPNGKVDRRSLPEPTFAPTTSVRPVLPTSALERQIAAVWQRILGHDRIGIHDNYFDLGGDSLLLVRTHSALQAELDRPVPLSVLFQYPTVHRLAAHLSSDEDGSATATRAQQRAQQRLQRRDTRRPRARDRSSKNE